MYLLNYKVVVQIELLIGFFGRRQISLDFFTDYGARKIVHFFTAINSEKVSIIVRT